MSFSNIWDLRRFRMVTKVTLAQKAFSKLTKISTESYNHFSFTVKLLAKSMTAYNAAFPIGRKFPIRGKKYSPRHLCIKTGHIFALTEVFKYVNCFTSSF